MKGILFKPEMHKAIREGRKTSTMRVSGLRGINDNPDGWEISKWDGEYTRTGSGAFQFIMTPLLAVKGNLRAIKPRYRVGEKVYIKEAWCRSCQDEFKEGKFCYKLDIGAQWKGENPCVEGRWRSPLFMPQWAARDFIKITEVKAMRLQEMTFEDCLAEGIVGTKEWCELDYKAPKPLRSGELTNEEIDKEIDRDWEAYTLQAFASLWDSINPAYPWASNPWVFQYRFEVARKLE